MSHPADTILSKLIKSSKKVTDQMTGNKEMEKSIGVKVKEIYKQIGFMGLWKGLPTRIVMIGTLTGLQWWIYDSFKTSIGL